VKKTIFAHKHIKTHLNARMTQKTAFGIKPNTDYIAFRPLELGNFFEMLREKRD